MVEGYAVAASEGHMQFSQTNPHPDSMTEVEQSADQGQHTPRTQLADFGAAAITTGDA